MMQDLEQTLETLQRRIAALEAENGRLRTPPLPAAQQATSRRQMLLGGAGVVGALAGGSLLARAQSADAAAVTPAMQPNAARKEQALHITLTPLKSSGVYWARHEWHLEAHFNGAHAPTVIANAADDYMDEDVTAACTCSVRLQGKPGAYVAVIMVRGVHKSSRTVEVNALALDI
jgi:hypothetical protein